MDGSLPPYAGGLELCLPDAGYNIPDWASWEEDPEAYGPDPYSSNHAQIRCKPWFPYNPADANSEDEYSDDEADVDISEIHIPGEHTL